MPSVRARWLTAVMAVAAACRTSSPPSSDPVPAPASTFDELASRLLLDPASAALDPEQRRKRREQALTDLSLIRALDEEQLTPAQRVDRLILESVLKERVRDTTGEIWRRHPSRYLTSIAACPAHRGSAARRHWQALSESIDLAAASVALGRRHVVAPAQEWVDSAVATARRQRDQLRGAFRDCVVHAPRPYSPGLLIRVDRLASELHSFALALTDSIPAGPSDAWKVGRDYYDWLVRERTGLPYNADSIIAEGRRMLAATQRRLDSLSQALHPGTGWRLLTEALRRRHPVPGGVAAEYQRQSDRIQAFLTDRGLLEIPAAPSLAFTSLPPDRLRVSAWARYEGLKESQVTVVDVAPGMKEEDQRVILGAQNYGWIPVVAAHEGYPGHHLQFIYTSRNPQYLRRNVWNSFYVEGWAFYIEDWMAREGLFDTPDSRIGHLQLRLMRAARAILDPSLHTGGMSYEQAVQFLIDEVALDRQAAQTEVRRFTWWPTQAASYLVGWLEIERLKQEVQARESERFSESRFAQRILEAGPLPLGLLRRVMLEGYATEAPQ